MTSLATRQTEPEAGELERLRAEVAELHRRLRHAQRLGTVGTMTAMIVHEFRNILTPIINYAHLATSGDEEMVAKAIAKAADGGQRASDICNALLGLLREESPDPVPVDVADVIEQSLLAMGRNLAKDGIELHLDVPAGLVLRTRPAELKQVLVNLLLNARAAILSKTSGGEVTLTADRREGGIAIRVADTGVGIPPEHLDRVFEPFFTTKTGKDGEELGNGLGLALCREIITDMGGEIRVESTPGAGSTFHLLLPA